MFLFILPYSKKQHSISFKDCTADRFNLPEFEPFARTLEKEFVQKDTLAPLYRRFASPFWESLELWVMPQRVLSQVEESSLVLSPVYGLLKPTACVPYAPVDWQETHQGKTLFEFWREHIKKLSHRMFKDKIVVPLISKKYLSLFDFSEANKVLSFEYYRKDTKVKNPSKHQAYTMRYMVEKGIELSELSRINFLDYNVVELRDTGKMVLVRLRSEGSYEL